MYSLNKQCFCGSGKQYKRCHMNKSHKKIKEVEKFRVIKSSIEFLKSPLLVIDKKPNVFEELKFVKNVENLPIEIKDDVLSKTLEFKPKFGDCIPLSMFLSSSIDGVNLEIGLFKTKNVGIGLRVQNPKKEQWYDYFTYGKMSVYIDENGEKWGIHCWNSYNGIQFDCLKDFKFKVVEPNEWIEYKRIQSISFIPKSNFDKEFVVQTIMKNKF
jgi:hypothetical protein